MHAYTPDYTVYSTYALHIYSTTLMNADDAHFVSLISRTEHYRQLLLSDEKLLLNAQGSEPSV